LLQGSPEPGSSLLRQRLLLPAELLRAELLRPGHPSGR
jgi:hypothetical protein